MALTAGTPEQLQKGFAYLAHASRSDERLMTAAAEEMGTWQDAAFIFAATTTELMYQLARSLDTDITTLAVRLAQGAAQAKGAATQ